MELILSGREGSGICLELAAHWQKLHKHYPHVLPLNTITGLFD